MEGNEKNSKADDPTGDNAAGNKPEAVSLVERARQEREGLAKENERLEKNIKELRELEAQRLLGGTGGGRVEPTPAKEPTPQEYARAVLEGKIGTPRQEA